MGNFILLMHRVLAAFMGGTGFLLTILCAPVSGATFAIVLGADEYVAERALNGAVADALDIADALEKFGADEVILLTNEQVTKAAIQSGFDRLLNNAQAGDTLIFSYAGHGSQAPETFPGTEADGLDEFFLLPGFESTQSTTNNEFIRDDELYNWFALADQAGVQTILIADSCFSGGMRRGGVLGTRLAPSIQVALPFEGFANSNNVEFNQSTLNNAIFISASLESLPTPEVLINGAARGALSYAFARALEGLADGNGDGQISFLELETQISTSIKAHSAAMQTPTFFPRSEVSLRSIIFELNEAQVSPAKVAEAIIKPISFNSQGTNLSLNGIIAGDDFPYQWEADTQNFVTPLGDIGAHNVSVDQLQSVVDKFRLLEFLKERVTQSNMDISLLPQLSLNIAGQELALSIHTRQSGFVSVFNLPGNGISQYLGSYNLGEGASHQIAKFRVVAPFGGDHLVAIAHENADLGDALKQLLENEPSSTELIVRLPELLENTRVGIQPLFTAGN